MSDDEDRPLTAIERQGVDSGTTAFDTVEEMQEAEAAFQLEHEAVLRAFSEALAGDDDDESDVDDEDAPDLDDYDDLLEGQP